MSLTSYCFSTPRHIYLSLGCMMGFEPTHIGITIRGLKPLDDTHHVETLLISSLLVVINLRSTFSDPASSLECFYMVRPEGFEPPTPAFVAQCSIQMSYGRIQNLAVPGGNDPPPHAWQACVRPWTPWDLKFGFRLPLLTTASQIRRPSAPVVGLAMLIGLTFKRQWSLG